MQKANETGLFLTKNEFLYTILEFYAVIIKKACENDSFRYIYVGFCEYDGTEIYNHECYNGRTLHGKDEKI